MKSRFSALSIGFFIISILAIISLCRAAETDPKVKAYGDVIAKALVSKQINSIMKLIPKDLVIYDGSNYGVIREKFLQFIGDVIEADITKVTPIESGLNRVTVSVMLKSNRSVPIHFDVSGEAGRFRIADIYDESELRTKGALKTLRTYASYENESEPDFPGFSYMQSSDADLARLRITYDLDNVAGNGTEIDQVIKLMQWVHNLVPHDGNSLNPSPQNAFNIIEVCRRDKRGVNCRMLATLLNEVYLAMGFKSRMVTCLPADINDADCHVTNLVFSKTLNKWIYMDPSFEAYFTDRNGTMLNHAEIREAIIDGTPIEVNDALNRNGKPYQGGKTGYIRYMTKNFVRFSCTLRSEFGAEDKYALYAELYPKGYPSYEEANSRTSGKQFLCISNPEIFWGTLENEQNPAPGQ